MRPKRFMTKRLRGAVGSRDRREVGAYDSSELMERQTPLGEFQETKPLFKDAPARLIMTMEADPVTAAESYYDSAPAIAFYKNIWGGEDNAGWGQFLEVP